MGSMLSITGKFDVMIVMMPDGASLRLLMASEIIAIEFERKPTVALKPMRIKFAQMLMRLVLTTTFSRWGFMMFIMTLWCRV